MKYMELLNNTDRKKLKTAKFLRSKNFNNTQDTSYLDNINISSSSTCNCKYSDILPSSNNTRNLEDSYAYCEDQLNDVSFYNGPMEPSEYCYNKCKYKCSSTCVDCNKVCDNIFKKHRPTTTYLPKFYKLTE